METELFYKTQKKVAGLTCKNKYKGKRKIGVESEKVIIHQEDTKLGVHYP